MTKLIRRYDYAFTKSSNIEDLLDDIKGGQIRPEIIIGDGIMVKVALDDENPNIFVIGILEYHLRKKFPR